MVYAQNRVQQRCLDKIFREDLLEVFKILSGDSSTGFGRDEDFRGGVQNFVRGQSSTASREIVVVMLTLVLSLNGPRSSCGCGRTVLFSWCWPSGMRRCVTSSASTAATWVARQRKSASSFSSISSRPTTLQPRPGSRTTTSSMLWCREEEEEDEEDVGREGELGIPSHHLGCHLGFWQSCVVSWCCLRRTPWFRVDT